MKKCHRVFPQFDRRKQALAALSAVAFSALNSVRADLITDWNETALASIQLDKTPPPQAARSLVSGAEQKRKRCWSKTGERFQRE